MFVVNGKNELKEGFRVLCESSASTPDKDYVEVTELRPVTNGASINFIMRDGYSSDAARMNLSPATARRFAETLLAFLDTLE